MKKLIASSVVALLPLIATTGTQAGTIALVNEDGTKLSELCVSAATSKNSVFQVAQKLGINTLELSQVACNGEPLMSFVREQRKIISEQSTANYSFNHGDDTIETDLCVAAVTAPEKFEELKPEYFSIKGPYVDKVLCNSQPLNVFVKRYGNPELSAL